MKYIHYFASTYYTELGQLRDSGREYRREKKLRRLQRLSKMAAQKAGKDDKMDGEEEDSDEPDSSEAEGTDSDNESTVSKSRKAPRIARRTKQLAGTDMYKTFDGSALMAIGAAVLLLCSQSLMSQLGMLLQHHVEGLVKLRIPEGWTEAMLEEEVKERSRRDTGSHRARMKGSTTEYIPDLSLKAPQAGGVKTCGVEMVFADGVIPVIDDSEDEDYVPE